MTRDHDISFRSMGCDVRFVIEPAGRSGLPPVERAAEEQRRFVESFAARLSRFRSDSELSHLNADPATAVAVSPLLRAAVRSAVWAARRTGGLVDPTLVGALEAVGYADSRDVAQPAPLADALNHAPPRRPASPDSNGRWRAIEVDESAGVVRRPPGVRIDTGGTGKGLAADAVLRRLAGYARVAVDCGGDIAVGGPAALVRPYEIDVEHPLTREHVHTVHLASGGVATSGIDVRIWRRGDGTYAHHLLDPSTGEPAWTGLIAATAVGGTALEAETLSKQALLSGPDGARAVLAKRGGVLIHDDGDVELVGPVSERPRLRLRLPPRAAA